MPLQASLEIIAHQLLAYLMSGQKVRKKLKELEKNLGGTMRLGLYDAVLKNNSLISKIYSEKKKKKKSRETPTQV